MEQFVPLIECRDLCKRYDKIPALNQVNLQLPAGKIIGLLGPNGSGKTTFIKLLAGLLRPSQGEARIAGLPIGEKTKALVSYLPDRMYFDKWMRTSDLIDMFADFYADFRPDLAIAMCRSLGILMDAKIENMSKGTQEKLQLIVAMCRRARLYLLDEPIAGVDPAAREFIMRTILTHHSPDSTVIISTHLISEVEQVLHEAIFLRQGQVVCYDSVENLRNTEGKSLDELFREIFRAPVFGGDWLC